MCIFLRYFFMFWEALYAKILSHLEYRLEYLKVSSANVRSPRKILNKPMKNRRDLVAFHIALCITPEDRRYLLAADIVLWAKVHLIVALKDLVLCRPYDRVFKPFASRNIDKGFTAVDSGLSLQR